MNLCFFDLNQVCLSKGLGAPVGSVIVGSKAFITKVCVYSHSALKTRLPVLSNNLFNKTFVLSFKARRLRKTLGGGMRQVGVLCAAALVAIQENIVKLEGDHENAKILAG